MPSAGLGRPGTTTTALGFGCSAIAGLNTRRESLGLLAAAVELGIRHFDVARSYGSGDAEAILGDFLATTNEPCTVTSKCGIAAAAAYGLPGPRTKALVRAALRKVPGLYGAVRSRATASVQGGQFDPEQIRQSLETSLRARGATVSRRSSSTSAPQKSGPQGRSKRSCRTSSAPEQSGAPARRRAPPPPWRSSGASPLPSPSSSSTTTATCSAQR